MFIYLFLITAITPRQHKNVRSFVYITKLSVFFYTNWKGRRKTARTRSKHNKAYFVQENMPSKAEILIPDYFGLKRLSEAKRKAHTCLASSAKQPAEVCYSFLHLKRNL